MSVKIQILLSIMICIVIGIICYVVGACGAWTWNPGLWEAAWRGFLCLVWLALSAIFIGIIVDD